MKFDVYFDDNNKTVSDNNESSINSPEKTNRVSPYDRYSQASSSRPKTPPSQRNEKPASNNVLQPQPTPSTRDPNMPFSKKNDQSYGIDPNQNFNSGALQKQASDPSLNQQRERGKMEGSLLRSISPIRRDDGPMDTSQILKPLLLIDIDTKGSMKISREGLEFLQSITTNVIIYYKLYMIKTIYSLQYYL